MSPRGKSRAVKTLRSCRDIIGLLTEYLEGGLAPAEVRRLEAHLTACEACAGFLETLRKTRAALPAQRAASVPETCRRALRAFLKKEIKRDPAKGRAGS